MLCRRHAAADMAALMHIAAVGHSYQELDLLPQVHITATRAKMSAHVG